MRLGLGEGIRALHQSGVVDLFIGTDTLTVRWFLKKVGIPKSHPRRMGSAWSIIVGLFSGHHCVLNFPGSCLWSGSNCRISANFSGPAESGGLPDAQLH